MAKNRQEKEQRRYPADNCSFEVWDEIMNDWADVDQIMGLSCCDDLRDSDGGFALTQDGEVVILDSMGLSAKLPNKRFRIAFRD